MNHLLNVEAYSEAAPRRKLDDLIELGAAPGRVCIAVAMIAFGVQHFVYGDFVTRILPKLPSWVPARSILAYGFGAYLVAAGTLLLLTLTARRAALALGATIFATFAFLYLPMCFADFSNIGLWTNAGKALAISGGAFLAAGSLPVARPAACSPATTLTYVLEKFIPLGRHFLAAFFAYCGVLHFIYVKFVAGLIPAWIPSPVFWTYFSGMALIAGGVGISFPPTRRLAAICSSVMVSLWVVLLHIPRAAANLRDSNETTAVFEAIAIAGTAWLAATHAIVRPRL